MMDKIISNYAAYQDDDLMICDGVAYQKDMTNLVTYDKDYFNKCLGYEDEEIALKINYGRAILVAFYHSGYVLDIGIGSGEFIKKRMFTFGYDINPTAIKWLKEVDLYSDKFSNFTAFTMWDVIEHVQEPGNYFKQMKPGSYLFTSIPLFKDLNKIRESKHYRPDEHLYYFTEEGLKKWMRAHGFCFLEMCDFEKDAGREEIYSFVFIKAHG